MPENPTITAFTTFVANTKAKSQEVNANFSNFRGHLIPIEPNTITASDNTYDLGSTEYYWRKSYTSEIDLRTSTSTATLILKGDTSNTTGSFLFQIEGTTKSEIDSGGLLGTGIKTGTVPRTALDSGVLRELKRTRFTSNGTFNVPSNVSYVLVQGVGGGGGGGGGSGGDPASTGGSGGGGSQPQEFSVQVTPSGTVTITIGTGGSGGAGGAAGGTGNNGAAGVQSSFGTDLVFAGGLGGAAGGPASAGGASGTTLAGNAWYISSGAGGAFGAVGSAGTRSFYASSSNGGSAGGGGGGGGGGASFLGGGNGGSGGIAANGADGIDGAGQGAGGGGAGGGGNGSYVGGNGGNGSSGYIDVYYVE